MEKKAIEHLEVIYKEELDSHNIKKAINNVNIMPKNISNLKRPSSKNIKTFQDSLAYRNNKDRINFNILKPKESNKNIYACNSEKSQKEEDEKINDLKVTKGNNFGLKVSQTIKNCRDNINKAKFIFFSKSNKKQSMKPIQNFNKKNCLTSNKRGSYFPKSSKKLRKFKEKESSVNIEISKKKNVSSIQ